MAGKPTVMAGGKPLEEMWLNGLDKPLTAAQENYLLPPLIAKEPDRDLNWISEWLSRKELMFR